MLITPHTIDMKIVASPILYQSLAIKNIASPIPIPNRNALSLKPKVISRKKKNQRIFLLTTAQKVNVKGRVITVTS